MSKYSKDSKFIGLIIALSVFISLLIFSYFYPGFSIETQLWLVNISAAITYATAAYFILYVSKMRSEALRIGVAVVVAVLYLSFNPWTIPPPVESVEESAEKQLPENVEDNVDSAYEKIDENYETYDN